MNARSTLESSRTSTVFAERRTVDANVKVEIKVCAFLTEAGSEVKSETAFTFSTLIHRGTLVTSVNRTSHTFLSHLIQVVIVGFITSRTDSVSITIKTSVHQTRFTCVAFVVDDLCSRTCYRRNAIQVVKEVTLFTFVTAKLDSTSPTVSRGVGRVVETVNTVG